MSNNIQKLLADLTLIANQQDVKFDISKYKPISLTTTVQTFHSINDLVAYIENQGSISGWVQETSFIHHLYKDTYKWRSIPLNAEWHDGDSTSFILDYIGKNVWQITSYAMTQNDEPTHLAEKMVQYEVDSNRKLVYQRLWSFKENAPVADIAVFDGFEGE